MTRRPLVLASAAGAATLMGHLALGCESSVQVGERAPQADAAAPERDPPIPLPAPAKDDGGASAVSWRRHAPEIPCSIYAMDEHWGDELFVGCNGGRVYRFDGVRAQVSLDLDDESVVSLLWAAPGDRAWAAAQTGFGPDATSELHRFDGHVWSKVPFSGERITSLTGTGANDVWITTASQIRRWNGSAFATVFTTTNAELRACTFAAVDKGWCTGTNGLAVMWNGATWTPMTRPPWSANAEVYGVEVIDDVPMFFFGEPAKGSGGKDVEVRIATWRSGAFQLSSAKVPSSTSYNKSRKRTGHAVVNARTYPLLSLDDQYGQTLVADWDRNEFRELCGRALAFSAGSAKTRVGGAHGLFATVAGSGSDQIALSTSMTTFEPKVLAVAPDGTAWARIEDMVLCGVSTERLVRWEDREWRGVVGLQPVQGGWALAAADSDHAYTLTLPDFVLAESRGDVWTDRGTFEPGFSLYARKPNDVWIGGRTDELAHFDGKAITTLIPTGRNRQVEQVVADPSGVVWMVARDEDEHVYRYAAGKREEWNLGIALYRTHVSALDGEHAWLSGEPAKVWNGRGWTDLPFDASNVWARAENEVYFTFGGDIFRWDGVKR
ncbi:MAG TPA: hypothetical protein VM925_06385, partial [Labilithrix sp.]|nr:hypothetical protein [Labilithrix sp.]